MSDDSRGGPSRRPSQRTSYHFRPFDESDRPQTDPRVSQHHEPFGPPLARSGQIQTPLQHPYQPPRYAVDPPYGPGGSQQYGTGGPLLSPRGGITGAHQFHHPGAVPPSTPYGETYPPPSRAIVSPTYPSMGLAAHKRAFRQRRKDPSCDACRERKVKCDATDSTSCSECTSRGVKCQFTKETNRRMSSLKQLQDLERQLFAEKRQNRHLKSLLHPGEPMDVEPATLSPSPTFAESSFERPASRALPSAHYDYRSVRESIRSNAQEIFEVPPLHRYAPVVKAIEEDDSSPLPPREIADRLAASYLDSFHVFSPVVDWAAFWTEYERLYKSSTFRNFSSLWVAQFYAIIAIGSLQLDVKDLTQWTSTALLEQALHHARQAGEESSINYCRVAVLISLIGVESGLRSLSRRWLAISISCAVEQGLHRVPTHPTPDIEERRTLWLTIYMLDRLLALEGSRPMQIEDDDCDVYPSRAGRSLQRRLSATGVLSETEGHGLLDVAVSALRLGSQLRKTLRAPVVPFENVQSMDQALEWAARSFPGALRPDSSAYLNPSALWVVAVVANMQILLHRQNLSPYANSVEHALALRACVQHAQKTVRAISRSMEFSSQVSSRAEKSWEDQVRACAMSFLCTHLWRCMLVLSLALDFEGALTCARLSAAIGNLRKVNLACGRYLILFLERLRTKIRGGQVTRESIEQDPELIALASGDLQGVPHVAWIWGDEAPSGQLHGLPSSETEAQESSAAVLPEALIWDNARYLLQMLMEEQRQRPDLREPSYSLQSLTGSVGQTTGSSHAPASVEAESTASSAAGGAGMISPGMAERMSIASILGSSGTTAGQEEQHSSGR